ncbi:MAG: hypothetical protein R2750_07655 [Bacteroidales bacterium]
MGNLNRIILLLLIIVPLNSVVKANTETSNINSDTILLNYNWRWLSFPRMPRNAFADEPYSSVSLLENINWFPTDLTLESLDEDFKQYDPNTPPYWTGQLEEVYSTKGYKLNFAPTDLPAPHITLTGARLHPDAPVELNGAGQPTWIGYFIEESQYPWDAFPANLYNTKLMLIKAQYWTMVKDEAKGWKLTGKITPSNTRIWSLLKKTNSSTPIQFSWNSPGDSEENVEIPEPQNYTWEEKADYIPFFIETDSSSDIAEIAVMVDEKCLGAQ